MPAFRVDWQPPPVTTLDSHASGLLDATAYRTTFVYDALTASRPCATREDVDGERKELRPHYNRAGALERVELDGKTFVERIAYNAKGQRTLIAYGNGVMTRYAYDPHVPPEAAAHRALHPAGALAYRPTGASLAGLRLRARPGGNVTLIRDRRPEAGSPIPRSERTRSTGPSPTIRSTACCRPRAASATCRQRPPWNDAPRCTDLTRTRGYTERTTTIRPAT